MQYTYHLNLIGAYLPRLVSQIPELPPKIYQIKSNQIYISPADRQFMVDIIVKQPNI
jgi:hypothetical protein